MIKLFAFLFMLLAHIGYLYFPNSITIMLVGRLAFPLFAWGIAEGFKYSKNTNQYLIRLFAIAILSQYPYYLVFHSAYLNVCFTLFAGLISLKLYKSTLNMWWKIPLIILVFVVADVMNFEYGMYGIGLILLFYKFGTKLWTLPIYLVITLLGVYFYHYNIVQLFSVLSIIVISICKNKNFKINQYVSYAFYPLQFIVLYLASSYIG
ncbi:hypothetical protein GC101_29175 [Paenibacillus sp. LMG 31459]|uniref:Conjugal transfer protein TraX n=1 Tax=Paenibacillus phytohabitans TaxID=2654978 RepID=A0ABX1YS85_9BACL|nr:TraX family protein [Paenibacillus phytohabitans]NOU82941.1 hypothetical protein [Paenibacillus phytohabitans]